MALSKFDHMIIPAIHPVPSNGFSRKRVRKMQAVFEAMNLGHVIVENGLAVRYFVSQIPVLNKDGDPIMIANQRGEYVKTEKIRADKVYKKKAYETLFSYPLDKIVTPNDTKKPLKPGSDGKKLCDKMKKYVNDDARDCSVWYHPAHKHDEMNELYRRCPHGPHYHILVNLKKTSNVTNHDRTRNFRSDCNKIKISPDIKRVVSSKSVGNNVKMLQYITDGHLYHLGTNNADLLEHIGNYDAYELNEDIPIWTDLDPDAEDVSSSSSSSSSDEDERATPGEAVNKKKRFGKYARREENDSDSDSDSDSRDVDDEPPPKKFKKVVAAKDSTTPQAAPTKQQIQNS